VRAARVSSLKRLASFGLRSRLLSIVPSVDAQIEPISRILRRLSSAARIRCSRCPFPFICAAS
jgi:hypothetical protein